MPDTAGDFLEIVVRCSYYTGISNYVCYDRVLPTLHPSIRVVLLF